MLLLLFDLFHEFQQRGKCEISSLLFDSFHELHHRGKCEMSLLLFDLFHELHQENVKWCILYVVSKRLVLQKVVQRLRSYSICNNIIFLP